MKLSYIKHSTSDYQNLDLKILVKRLGAEGYGAYWLLIEILANVENNRLEYNLKKLAILVDAKERIIREVVEESGLFQIENGYFWSPSLSEQVASYSESIEKKKQGIRRRWEAVKTKAKQAEGATKKEPETPQPTPSESTPAPSQPSPQPPAQESPAPVVLSPEIESDPAPGALTAESVEEIIAAWNDVFKGTAREHRGFDLDPLAYANARASFNANYTLDDMRRAFEVAKSENFAWLLRDVLKPINIQRLLTRGEINGKHGEHTEKDDGDAWGVDWSQYESNVESATYEFNE